MRARAKISVNLPSQQILDSLIKALTPEMKRQPYARSTATLSNEGKMLILTVEARDTTALRATLNAHLRWINAAMNVLSVLNGIGVVPIMKENA